MHEKVLSEASSGAWGIPERTGKVAPRSMADYRSRAQASRVLDQMFPNTQSAYQPDRLTAPGGGDIGAYARQHGKPGVMDQPWTGERLSREYGGRSQMSPLALRQEKESNDAINTRDFDAWLKSIEPKPEPGGWTPEGEHKERGAMLDAHQAVLQDILDDEELTEDQKIAEFAAAKQTYETALYGLGWGTRPRDPKPADPDALRPGETAEQAALRRLEAPTG